MRIKIDRPGLLVSSAHDIAMHLVVAFRAGNKLLIAGNGGSAADAQHIAAEFVGRYKRNRKALPAIALSSDPAVITAIANDFGFEKVFSRQVEALGKGGDVLIAISTSGRSSNIMLAIHTARAAGMLVVGLLGASEAAAEMLRTCDLAIMVDSGDTAVIQQGYMEQAHVICGLVEDMFCE